MFTEFFGRDTLYLTSDVVSLPGLRPLDGVAGTGAPPDISKTVTIMSLLFLWH